MSVRTPEGFVRKSTWQVADVRRPLVSASHIIQAGNDLFIGKDEAYIINRKKKDKSMLRKEGNVYVLDLFVRVPPNVTAPVTYTPMEVDANVSLQQFNFLTAGGVSVEDKSKRTETVRPPLNERCERRQKCDSVLGATNDENDVELNGETDDEDMEDGEMGFDDGSAKVRKIRDPGQPTVKEHQEHMTAHRPYRSWCKFCVMGRGVNAPHRRSDAQDDLEGVPHVSMDHRFLGKRESEEHASPVLVIRERRHKMTWAMLVPRKGTEFSWIAKRAARFIDQLGHNTVTLRCDNEPAIEAVAREIAQARQEGSQTVPERLPVGDSQSNGVIERAVGLVAGQARPKKAALEHRIGTRIPPDARILCWLVEFVAYLTIWPKGQHTHSGIRREDPVHAGQASERGRVGAAIPILECLWGMLNLSSEAVVVTEQGMAIKTRSANIRRIPESERWDADRILGIRAVPWSPDGSDNAVDIQVGMERPADMVPRDPGEVLTENKVARTYLRRADFERWGLSEGCPGCRHLRTGQGRQQAHSEACRRRIEGLLKGDPSGSARLAAADERINRALADAVERHAAKDPGVRGILKKASAACHPESESQKKLALDTEQDSTPRPSVSYGGSSASGTRPSTATRTAQDADTSDVTIGTGPELARSNRAAAMTLVVTQ